MNWVTGFIPTASDTCVRAGALAQLYPRPLLEETVRIAERCHFSLDELRYEYPSELVPKHHTPNSWLRRLTEQGMQTRWPGGRTGKNAGID